MAERMKVYRPWKLPKWLPWFLALLAALAGVGLIWWHDAAAPERGRTVEVLLTGEDGAPLAGEPVLGLIDTSALAVDSWQEQRAVSDQNGVCRFPSVAPGSYWLRARGITAEVDVPPTSPAAVRRTVALAPDEYNVTLRLTDSGGAPLKDTAVTVEPFGLEGGGSSSFAGRTDWQGVLVWKEAPAGAHRLHPQGMAPVPLVLEPGETKILEATLRCAGEAAPLQARLLRANGAPLANEPAALVAYAIPGGKEVALQTSVTDGGGNVTFTVPPGGRCALRAGGRRFRLDSLDGTKGTVVQFRL